MVLWVAPQYGWSRGARTDPAGDPLLSVVSGEPGVLLASPPPYSLLPHLPVQPLQMFSIWWTLTRNGPDQMNFTPNPTQPRG